MKIAVIVLMMCWGSVLSEDQNCPTIHYEFPNQQQITNYIRYRSYFPQLYKAGTVCTWIQPANLDSYLPIASYAIDGAGKDNEILIYIQRDRVNVWISAKAIPIPVDLHLSTSRQTHLCVWFSVSKNQVGLYVDGVEKGTVSYSGDAVEGGGVLIVGQEQDSKGGGFDPTQSYQGTITNIMFWPRELNSCEILKIAQNCICPRDTSVVMSLDRAEIYGETTYNIFRKCPTL